MIERAAFTAELKQRLRFVLQQNERAVAARAERDQLAVCVSHGSYSAYATARLEQLKQAVLTCEIGVDAALDEFADFVYDVVEGPLEAAVLMNVDRPAPRAREIPTPPSKPSNAS